MFLCACVRACVPACVCAQVGCYSYRLLIDPDNWQGVVECKAAIGPSSEPGARPGE